MNFSNIIFKIIILVQIVFLTSCGLFEKPDWSKPANPSGIERARKNVKEGRGIDFGFGNNKGGDFLFASSNPMWRATVDILDFLPLSNVDYSGGIIITDWYNEGTAGDESIKITVRFLTNEVRADGIKVIIHKKKCGVSETCTIKKISSALENELKVAILKKAVVFAKEDTLRNRKKRPDLK